MDVDAAAKSNRRRTWRFLCAPHTRVLSCMALLLIGALATLMLGRRAGLGFSPAERPRTHLERMLPETGNAALPLAERQQLFETRIASVLLRTPAVSCVVDELLRRVRHLLDAVAHRDVEEDSDDAHSDSDVAASGPPTSPAQLLQFAFATRDTRVAGAVGWELRDIRAVLNGGSRGAAAQEADVTSDSAASNDVVRAQQSELLLDLDTANLREKLTLLYVATMQATSAEKQALLTGRDVLTPEELRFYALQSDLSRPPSIFSMSLLLGRELDRWQARPTEYERWMKAEGVSIDLLALAQKRQAELTDGSVHAVQAHRFGSVTAMQRKCFIPLFVPAPSSAVRQCRCIDSHQEHQSGCRKVRDRWLRSDTDATGAVVLPNPHPLVAADVHTPHLSRREVRFALPQSAPIASNIPSKLSAASRRARDLALLHSRFWTSEPLPWVAGADVFEEPSAQGSNALYQQIRELTHSSGAAVAGSRFVAGPSSTTTAILQLAQYFGMGDRDELLLLRMGMIAYLVPARDHSILEVLVASEQFGLEPSLAHMRAAAAEDRAQPHSAQHFATALPLTHIMPDSTFVPPYCASDPHTELTNAVVHDAMALEVLDAFAPSDLREAALRTSLATEHAPEKRLQGECSRLLAAYWTLLRLDTLHAQQCQFPGRSPRGMQLHRCERLSSDSGDPLRHPCSPTAMLQSLARRFYA